MGIFATALGIKNTAKFSVKILRLTSTEHFGELSISRYTT